MAKTKRSKGLILILLVVAALVIVALPIGCLTNWFGITTIIHGNVHSEGYKQGYIFTASWKKDSGFKGVTKIYKLELSPLGWGNGLHSGKPGQPEDGGNWACNWEDDEAGKALWEVLVEVPPDAPTRCWYTEHDVAIKGTTRYRLKQVDWFDPVDRKWHTRNVNVVVTGE